MSGLFDNPKAYESPNWKIDSDGTEPGLICTPCSEIEEQRVDWLWKGYVPRSALTLLEGPPKAGKSTFLSDFAARVSGGIAMPDGQECHRRGSVLVLSGEDSPAHVIVPRLRVAGAILDAVKIIQAVDRERRPRQFVIGPDDIARLERSIDDSGGVLVIVDPLSIYMGATDAHREQEVRQCLWHLSELATRTGCAVLAVRHHKKAPTGDALTQGGGSVGFSAAARSILTVARDPDDKASRVLAVARSNYATEYPSLAFRLESPESEDVARVVWTGVSKHDADALSTARMSGEEHGALSEAKDFLAKLLMPHRHGLPSREVLSASDAAGIAKDTLRRAKVALGVQVSKDGLRGPWNWSLPAAPARTHEHDRIFDTDAQFFEGTDDRIFEGTDGDRALGRPHGDAWEGGAA